MVKKSCKLLSTDILTLSLPPSLLPSLSQGQALKDTPFSFYTWKEYFALSLRFGRALMALGFQAHGVINILGFNAVRRREGGRKGGREGGESAR
jgi:hypothetical protein